MFKHYPKLTAVLVTYLLALGVFAALGPDEVHYLIEPLGIGGIIVAGMLYTYGFTAAIGAVFLVALVPDYSPIVIALLGGVGATIADLTIFKLLKGPVHDEVLRMARVGPIKKLLRTTLMRLKVVRNTLGFLIIASPLPDEIGILLISMTRMNEQTFRVIDFAANVLGIYLLASAGTLLY